MMPETLEALKGEDCHQWRTKMATLLHYLMYLHTGFPDLYDPIIDLIKVRFGTQPGRLRAAHCWQKV